MAKYRLKSGKHLTDKGVFVAGDTIELENVPEAFSDKFELVTPTKAPEAEKAEPAKATKAAPATTSR